MTFSEIMRTGVIPEDYEEIISDYNWVAIILKHPHLASRCELSKLDRDSTFQLVKRMPELISKCDVSRFGVFCWIYLIRKDYNLYKFIRWDYLRVWDWIILLNRYPEFEKYSRRYAFEFNCGDYGRIIWIDRAEPEVINIGCFKGTKYEAIAAVRHKYLHGVNAYIAKINSCFEKVNKLCSG